MLVGCALIDSASLTLADCTVSDTETYCVGVSGFAQLNNSTLSNREEGDCVFVCDAGSHVTATSCRLHGGRSGALAMGGGRLTARSCESSGSSFGYYVKGGVMELLNSSTDGCKSGCCVNGGHLTVTNVAVTNSLADGFKVVVGNAELRGCSVTRSNGDYGMHFNCLPQQGVTEARVEDCTVAQNRKGGFRAQGSASVALSGCRSRDNGGAGFSVGEDAQMTVAHSSSDGDAAGCVAQGVDDDEDGEGDVVR